MVKEIRYNVTVQYKDGNEDMFVGVPPPKLEDGVLTIQDGWTEVNIFLHSVKFWTKEEM